MFFKEKPNWPKYRITPNSPTTYYDGQPHAVEELFFSWLYWKWAYRTGRVFKSKLDAEIYVAKKLGRDICGNCGTHLLHDEWGLFCPNEKCDCWFESNYYLK